jgi:hypothetical protein
MDMIDNYNIISRAKSLKDVQAQLRKIYMIEKKKFEAMDEISGEFTDEELKHLFCGVYFIQGNLKSKNNQLFFYKLQPDGYLKDISPKNRERYILKIKKLNIKKWRAIAFLYNYAQLRQYFDYNKLISDINDIRRVRNAKLTKIEHNKEMS